jgi:hypothetical protein
MRNLSPAPNTKEPREAESVSKLNMAFYDFATMDHIRRKVHEYFLESQNDGSYLRKCYEALDQFLVIFLYALSKGLQERLIKKMRLFEDKLISIEIRPKKMSQEEKELLRLELRNLIRFVYEAKQIIGLGTILQKKEDQDKLLEKALE